MSLITSKAIFYFRAAICSWVFQLPEEMTLFQSYICSFFLSKAFKKINVLNQLPFLKNLNNSRQSKSIHRQKNIAKGKPINSQKFWNTRTA